MGRIVVTCNPFAPGEARCFAHTGPLIAFLLRVFPHGFHGPHVTALNLKRLPVADYDTVLGDTDLVTIAIAPAAPALALVPVIGSWFAAGTAGALIVNAAVGFGVSYGLSKLISPKASKPAAPSYAPQSQGAIAAVNGATSPGTVYSFNGQLNTVRVGQTIPVAYGTNRLVPDLISQPYYFYDIRAGMDQSQFAVLFLCLGQGLFDVHCVQVGGREYDSSHHALGVVQYALVPPSAHQRTFGVLQGARPFWYFYENVYTAPEVSDQELADQSAGDGGEDVEGPVIGPFVVVPTGHWGAEWLIYDLVWPNGCYTQEIIGNPGTGERTPTGQTIPYYNRIKFMAYEIDEDGNRTGASSYFWHSEWICSTTPQRRTITHPVQEQVSGLRRWEVTAQRMRTKMRDAGSQSSVYWTAARSVLAPKSPEYGQNIYGDVTLMAIKIKASEGIPSDVHTRIRVCATRLDGSGANLKHPLDCFSDVFTNPVYGGRRPAAELDAPTLATLKTRWGAPTFDAVFDQSTTIWDALHLVIQKQHAIPITLGSTLSIVEDAPHTIPQATLNTDQLKSLSMAHMFFDSRDYDGVEVEYRDPKDNAPQYALWPEAAVNPDKMVLWGCRNRPEAEAYAKRFWKQTRLRRRMVTAETELDGRNFWIGQAIAISHPLLSATAAVLCIVSRIRPVDEVVTALELFVYEHEVYT
jgi:hypothetical protein